MGGCCGGVFDGGGGGGEVEEGEKERLEKLKGDFPLLDILFSSCQMPTTSGIFFFSACWRINYSGDSLETGEHAANSLFKGC